MNRKEEQSNLIFKLGLVLGPLVKIAESPEKFDSETIKKTAALFFSEVGKIESEFRNFTRPEENHFYSIENDKLHTLFHGLKSAVKDHFYTPGSIIKGMLEGYKKNILDVLLSIPVMVNSEILTAYTPFSTYCIIKDLCQTVKKKLIWIDRYFDDSLYYRYLRNVVHQVFEYF